LSVRLALLDATIDRFCTVLVWRFELVETTMPIQAAGSAHAVKHAVLLVRRVCQVAADPDFLDDAVVNLAATGVIDAVQRHDDAVLFDWLIQALSYQGVSNAIATKYMDEHGCVTAADLERSLRRPAPCPKLASYWQFHRCGYRKWAGRCSMPADYRRCPLPRHDLRNGRLNQTAYSLYLFMRDVADNDLVSWLDRRLAAADGPSRDRPARLAAAVVEPVAHVHGVSYKVVSMSLAALLLAGDHDRERWRTAGGAMIVIDSLVHNWLHRTGILNSFDSAHLYGPRCYKPGSCADIVRLLAANIDARRFNADFPKDFPRFVQHAIWAFCSQDRLNRCNGNRIDDRDRCDQHDCPLVDRCARLSLRPADKPAAAN
jgi:hypothetical protein